MPPQKADGEELYHLLMDELVPADQLAERYGYKSGLQVLSRARQYAKAHDLPWLDRCVSCGCQLWFKHKLLGFVRCGPCRKARQAYQRRWKRGPYVETLQEVADYLGMTKQNVALMIERGVLQKRGKDGYFSLADLDALKAAGYGDKQKGQGRKHINLDRRCPTCGLGFVGGQPTQIYCSRPCKQKAINDRYYVEHREERIEAAKNRKKRNGDDQKT